ncbi:MAG: hypothetical protein DRI86_01440 [Bacteroidetes bacterium]|nr:MAG: hypothetical protein DRI86_01440 [Bacteroidota bacterium]
MKIKIIILFLIISNYSISQNNHGIIIPDGKEYYKACGYCLMSLDSKPAEVMMSVDIEDDNSIVFVINDAQWFWGLIENSTDGIAADIVVKSDFDCSSDKDYSRLSVSKGKLLKPKYKSELLNSSMPDGKRGLVVNIGTLPSNYKREEVEVNALFLSGNNLCHYNAFVNVESYQWGLLDMGLYADTVIYEAKADTLDDMEKMRTYSRKFKLTVPFKKSKIQYSSSDIKPLYDSLNLTDFVVKSISIRAYASIEGSKKYNLRLQKGRAESIVKALQSFQNESISEDITTSENWMEFYEAIIGTKYEYLTNKTKQEIKKLLEDKAFALELEPILSKHRKGVVEIDFEKRYDINNATAEEIVNEFDDAIIKKDIDRASGIQKYSFSRILINKLPHDFLSKLEIPEQIEFGRLLNNNAVYQYFLAESNFDETYNRIKQLKVMDPNSKEIAYNYIVFRFQLWLSNNKQINYTNFKKEILALGPMGISSVLINRMMINYNIILTEIFMDKGDYDNKNKHLKIIKDRYRSTHPSSKDLLSLAEYFVSYAKYEWAIDLIEPYITRIDVDEDLLFYYINNTIIDPSITEQASYKQILLNAIDINSDRFCKMFNSLNNGGISFQLLEDPYLKSNYCQSCRK